MIETSPGRSGRSHLASGVLLLLVGLYIAFFSWMSVSRHQTFGSNAMDLGYTDQAVWNTLHGRLLQFSTYQGAASIITDLPLSTFRRTDVLLGYHVELLLAPISLLYLIYSSPITLLILQTVVLGLGALPAFWLARARLRSDAAALVFALAYLLAPAIEAANLSDFHAVSLTASLLLFAFYFLETRRYGWFFLSLVVAMSSKEDIPLLVFMIGLYVFFWLKERRVGALTAAMGLGWFAVCTRLILPYYSGLSVSPFVSRLAVFGPTVQESVQNVLGDPTLIIHWLAQPHIVSYLGGLLSSAGFMSLFSPFILLAGAPVAFVNVFSAWSWTYSEGAHYSASLVPFIIVSAIYGVDAASGWLAGRLRVPQQTAVLALCAIVLVSSVYHTYQIGATPIARAFQAPRSTAHDHLGQSYLAMIPRDASVSASSALYPHLSQREHAYLFPIVNDAEYVFVDVTSTPYPASNVEVYNAIQRLLMPPTFKVLGADDGYVLLKRGTSSMADRPFLPQTFLSFVRAGERPVRHPLLATFGDALQLVGYDYAIGSAISAGELPATVTTYWRALRPLDTDYTFAFFFTREDGAIVGQFADPTATSQWYPTSRWGTGELVRIELPPLPIGRLHDVMVTVTTGKADPISSEGRLLPITSGGARLDLVQEGTLLKLFSFP